MNFRTTALAATLCLAFAPAIHAAGETGGMGAHQNSSSSMSMNQDTVRQVQQELSQKGYNPGPVDGMMGQQTKSALKEYQQSQGMSATGKLDKGTMDALGVEADSSTSSSRSGMSTTTAGTSSGTTGATPNRSGSGAPTGDDTTTSPTQRDEATTGTMKDKSGSGSMSGSSGTTAPNRSGSGAPTGDDTTTSPTQR